MRDGRGGHTLVELMAVVAVLGVMAAMGMPRMQALLAHIRTRGALNRVVADLAYTRHLAVRTGRTAALQVEPSGDCPAPPSGVSGHRYRIVVAGPDSVAARVDLRLDAGRVCLTSNQSARVAFNSRGLLAPFNNRTLFVRHGTYPADTLRISVVGRMLRRY
jgi:prepilin-type N-terminal cleavage/methylation domain-containing protein